MHTHNTLPNAAQKYHVPIWKVPNQTLDDEDNNSIRGNTKFYTDTLEKYKTFTEDMITRIELLDKK